MSDALAQVDLDQAKDANLREVLRLSECYLDGTTKFALAADARATNLALMTATLMTAAAALGAAIIALPSDHPSQFTFFVAVAAFAAAVCFAMALLQAVAAARPQPFDVPGNCPDSFTPADLYGEPKALLLAQAQIYQRQIDNNVRRLHEGAAALTTTLIWLRWAPIVAVLAGVIAFAVRFPYG